MAQDRKTEPGPAVPVVMLAVFLFSLAVQLNDPDGLVWVLIYGLAATACLLAVLRRGHWSFPALVGVIALVWAVTIAPRVIGRVPFLDMFGAFEMANTGIEESREMYGLLIIAVYMTVLVLRGLRAKRRTAD